MSNWDGEPYDEEGDWSWKTFATILLVMTVLVVIGLVRS